MTNRYLRKPALAKLLGVTVPTLWRWEQKGILPKAVRLSQNVSGYWLRDLPPAIRDQLQEVA